jgi:hypothetical protein
MGKKRLALHWVTILAIAFFAFLAISSASTPYPMWDETIPPEQSAKIWFVDFTPKSYNGMDVPEKMKLATWPAGDATFSGDIDWSYTMNYILFEVKHIVREKDVLFSCNLEGGQMYYARVGFEPDRELNSPTSLGIRLYKEGTKRENLIAFIPFDPPMRFFE